MTQKRSALTITAVLAYLITSAQTSVIDNTSQLSSEDIKEKVVFVKDLQAGGSFIHSTASLPIDNGVVFARKQGGVWIRRFDKAQGVNPCWWGAKGDGINDDLPAINLATEYCLKNETIMQFPSGIFRITGQWVIGGKSVEEEDLFAGQLTKSKSFKLAEHRVARQSTPLIIRGSLRTCIYGDFETTEPTAIVYYNINGNGLAPNPSPHFYTHEFSNIGIYGKGFFKGSKPTPLAKVDEKNQQIGLVMLYCNNSKIESCSFNGLKYGLVYKTSYFGCIKNSTFELCGTGIHTVDYNANLIENISGQFCKLLGDFNGSQLVFNNFNSEYCETALKIKGKNVVINGMYCENHNMDLANNYQLILGRGESDKGFSKKSVTTGIIINGLTLTAGGRDLILLQDDLQQIVINGATINGNIVTKKGTNKIISNSINGSYKIIGGGKQQKMEDKQ